MLSYSGWRWVGVAFGETFEARMAVFDFVEGWYNPHRRHPSLDFVSPIEWEVKNAA